MHRKHPALITAKEHTMGEALLPYLFMKMHHLIDESEYSAVIVCGKHDRQNAVISNKEKTGKRTNWQRPTAQLTGETLYIYCYPGLDYVRHYAAMIKSYLHAFKGRKHISVTYQLPSEKECINAVWQNGLDRVDIQDTVFIGYALDKMFAEVEFDDIGDFYYGVLNTPSEKVSLIIVKHSFWGDILGRFGANLAALGAKTIFFTGKVGGLKSELLPNISLATGNETFVEGEVVRWDNAVTHHDAVSVIGKHFTSPSVMFETKEWLKITVANFDFVDPEVGQLAKSCSRFGLRYGYIHIVSNILTSEVAENLSNERDKAVLEKRDLQIMKMKKILLNSILPRS